MGEQIMGAFDEQEHIVRLHDATSLHAILRKHEQPAISDGVFVLIHGRLDHANKGPLFRIISRLPFNTFRFSARGMGMSEGTTGYSHSEVEAGDLVKVLKFVQSLEPPFNRIIGMAGHSQGAVVGFQYLSNNPPIIPPLFVNISGRYSSHGTENRLPLQVMEDINKHGSATWLNYRAGPSWEKRPYIITFEALQAHRARILNGLERMPPSCSVLTVHGKEDGTVFPKNALDIDEGLQKSDCSSDLILVQGAGHNWDQSSDEQVLSTFITTWVNSRHFSQATKSKGELKDHLARP